MRQLPLPLPIAASLGFADFLEGPGNEEALAWVRAGDWPGGRLLLWGPPGSGKTHLLSAWAASRGVPLLHATALRGAPDPGPMALDEVDLVSDETALFHLLNANAALGAPMLMAARQPPARIAFRLPDLASRLRAVAACRIEAPGDELLGALFDKLLADRQLRIAPAIRRWLLPRLPRSGAALREAAARLDRAGLAAGTAVTRAMAAEVLSALSDDSSGTDANLPSRPGEGAC